MSGMAEWQSYFYPETYDPATGSGTLRNLFGERDADVLRDREYSRVRERQFELRSGQVHIRRTYDAEHLRAIHRHLFSDVYPWAGEFRITDIRKGPGREFGRVDGDEIGQLLSDAHQVVTSTDWAHVDKRQFAERSATVLAFVNQAHPFREGNGRTQKLFLEHVSEQSRFQLDYTQVTPRQWNQASQMSRPDLEAYSPWPNSLVPIFEAIAIERPVPEPERVRQQNPTQSRRAYLTWDEEHEREPETDRGDLEFG